MTASYTHQHAMTLNNLPVITGHNTHISLSFSCAQYSPVADIRWVAGGACAVRCQTEAGVRVVHFLSPTRGHGHRVKVTRGAQPYSCNADVVRSERQSHSCKWHRLKIHRVSLLWQRLRSFSKWSHVNEINNQNAESIFCGKWGLLLIPPSLWWWKQRGVNCKVNQCHLVSNENSFYKYFRNLQHF